ncbi:hypothetical protein L7F22_024375 [Adiantum nelumboides]|nr:hypothetical protein [Adiantum nelumboides]
MAFLVSGREDEEIKLRAFPLVLREEAKVWFQDLDMGKQGNWEALKRAFLLSLPEGERVPNFLQKERFLAELTPILREKVKCKFPESFKEALTWAKLKDRKLQFQKSWRDHSQAASRLTTQEQAHPSSPNGSGDPHLDRLRRVTKQLDSLSINFIHGLQSKQPVQQQVGGQGTNDEVPRRPPRREYQCHNYGEYEPGMYFCPYPRGYGNAPPRGPQQQVSPPGMRPPPMPMCEQQQQPQQHQPIQILRQSTYALVPQPTTEVPPLPHDGVERAMNTVVTSVYMLRSQHLYHPPCFVIVCKSAGQCLFHGCEEPLKDALKLLAPGKANMDEHIGTKKDLTEGVFGSLVDGIAHSQAGSSRKPNIDSMCGGCGDKNASQKQAGEDTPDQQKAEKRAEKRANVVEAQGDASKESTENLAGVEMLKNQMRWEDIAAKQDAKQDAEQDVDVTLDKVEEDQE